MVMCTLLTSISLHANVLTDPTQPATRQKTVNTNSVSTVVHSWKLESILVAPNRRVAVINGKLVSEGEYVDGARVIRIRALDVLVQTPNKRITLQLLPDIVTKIP